MKTKLKLFLDWGITFDGEFKVVEQANRKVIYADKTTLEYNILHQLSANKSEETEYVSENTSANSITQIPVNEPRKLLDRKGGIVFPEDKI